MTENELPCVPECPGLGPSLRAWRALRRVKQARAAELLGVSQATVSRWEAGVQAPSPAQAARLRALMAARLDGAGDRALADLVGSCTDEAHLVCDLTHRLLAVSRPRARRWGVPAADLLGRSLWRYASAEIVAAERRLADAGWFEPGAGPVRVFTAGNTSPVVPIRPGWIRWTRLRLSDGGFVRLVQEAPRGADGPGP